jgi:hypothetical protein
VHQNYYFLKQLAPRLHSELAGKVFIEAFSQQKDELIIIFGENVPKGREGEEGREGQGEKEGGEVEVER